MKYSFKCILMVEKSVGYPHNLSGKLFSVNKLTFLVNNKYFCCNQWQDLTAVLKCCTRCINFLPPYAKHIVDASFTPPRNY